MGNDQKRTLIAFLLIIVILLLWSYMAKPPGKKTTTQKEIEKIDTTKMQPQNMDYEHAVGDTIVVDRKFYKIVFSTAGAGIKKLYIKEYDVDLVPESGILCVTKLFDSIPDFNYKLYDDSIVFTREIDKKRFTKIYQFSETSGFILRTDYPQSIKQILSFKAGLGITEKKNRSDDLRHFNVFVRTNKLQNITKNIKEQFIYKEDWQWLALRSKYFVLIINNLGTKGYTEFNRIAQAIDYQTINYAYLGCAMGGNTNRYGVEIFADYNVNFLVLFLPIKHSELAKYNKGYEQITSGGIWGPIERVIILILNFFYSVVKNYGFAIIIFALLFKIIFFPLSRQMLISQQKMQMVQPELKKIQDKYKNDPQALNREMMHLYKTYKVNPFSGCLPLLIQFPIFIALYQVLSTSFEFRGAPFILWIKDLSVKDPYYILPIAMGVLMLLQSLMTTVDPRQRFMVIMMPLVMIFVFLNFPSGLQLYWFTYNLLSILEQFMIKKKILS